MRARPGAAWGLALASLASGCLAQGPRRPGLPFEDLTLQNVLRWPDGREWIEAEGRGRPPEGEKDQEVRKKAAREAAVMAAQERLVAELLKVVPRSRVQDLLRRAEVAELRYGYDDACVLRLRVPKEAVTGARPIE